MKSKVIFILVPSYSDSDWLNAKLMQMTNAFVNVLNINKTYPIYTVENYDEVNNFLDQAEFLVVVTAGNAIIERDIIWNKLHSIPEDVGLLAHLLQYSADETPYIHEQFFIIRTSAFSKLDFSLGTDVGIDLIRSKEDMHNGNAPLTVNKGIRIIQRELKFGTKLIIECLDNGYKVSNFDQEWRWPVKSSGYVKGNYPCRGFCYPEKNTELFATALKSVELLPGLDESQEMFITGIQQALKFQVLNAWSYDEIVEVNADHIFSPANGFLGEMLAVKSKASKLTFYDKNPNNIEFKKHLYKNWDGKDYTSFAIAWATERGLAVEPVLDSTKQMSKDRYPDIEEFYTKWSEWKETVIVEFIQCDLISDFDKLKLTPTSAIHTSTILTIFPFTHIMYDLDEINNIRNRINCVWIES